MFRCLASRLTAQLGRSSLLARGEGPTPSMVCNQARCFYNRSQQLPIIGSSILQCSNITQPMGPSSGQTIPYHGSILARQWIRDYHAKGSKVRYLDFRYRFNTSHYKSHLLIIRRQKMKKHRRIKWRKKFKCLLAKKRLKREIVKEKTFRVELLTMIKRAEQFDPREYAMRKINDINSVKLPPSREERLEELKELIRVNRYQVDYIKPKHKRIQTIEDLSSHFPNGALAHHHHQQQQQQQQQQLMLSNQPHTTILESGLNNNNNNVLVNASGRSHRDCNNSNTSSNSSHYSRGQSPSNHIVSTLGHHLTIPIHQLSATPSPRSSLSDSVSSSTPSTPLPNPAESIGSSTSGAGSGSGGSNGARGRGAGSASNVGKSINGGLSRSQMQRIQLGSNGDTDATVSLLLQIEHLKVFIPHVTGIFESIVELYKNSVDTSGM